MKNLTFVLSILLIMVQMSFAQGSARMQVIHNSADKAAATVDVYLWNGDSNELVIKLDDFAFRTATPFVDVPAGDSLAVIIVGSSSESETDQVVATIPVGALENVSTYVVIANC